MDYAGISIAAPYPGTRLWKQCVEKGYLKEDFDINKLFARNANINTEEFTAAELQKKVSKENLRFYLRFMLTRPIRFTKIIISRLR